MPSLGAALSGSSDTIAAIATASGRGALAVIRMSGPDAHAIAGRVIRPWPLAAREARLCALHEPVTGELLERPIVVMYDGARSYTGEPSVEISTHGGLAVPTACLAALVRAGAREALPGEFTRRAVLNGKLDLLQAEAVADLIDARSGTMHRAALTQLDGALSRQIGALRDSLLEIEALIAYDIDFPEEDDGPLPRARIAAACDTILTALHALLDRAPLGELVREGAVVVIAGLPNAGKSSLFNALIGRAQAIVTSVPGTTRDAIEAVVDAMGWPLRLVDTAGLRATDDVVERLGIEVSERYLSGAHAVLACGERDEDVAETVERVRALTTAPVIAVRTKSEGSETADREPGIHSAAESVAVSATTGAGLRELVAAVVRVLAARYGAPTADMPLVTRARHAAALSAARAEVEEFRERWLEGALPAPVAAVHVRAAIAALEELIGTVDIEQVLDRVFSSFCVGK